MEKFLKRTWKSLLSISLFYAILSVFVVLMVDQNSVQLDTNRVLSHAEQIAKEMESDSSLIFASSIKEISADADTAATETISDGSAYARELSDSEITITIPIIEDGRTISYLSVTDMRSSVSFVNFTIIIFSVLLWAFSVLGVTRRAIRLAQQTKNTVAKIRNIERSPLTQSYLITKGDDPVTTALNHLGDNIQQRILSNQETKENLYEFIEFFQFPIFVYDGKGAFHRSNAAFKNEFTDVRSIDAFSLYPDFLNFLVDKMVQPDIQDKTFYFDRINSYYQIQFNPLEMINNRYLVAMNDVSSYHQIMQAHTDFTANVSMAFQPPLDRIQSAAEELTDLKVRDEILKETSWLDELVNDTLALTSPSIKYKKSDIQVDQMVQEILSDFTEVIARKKLQLSLNLATLRYRSDPQRLQIIFKKLIGNALSYSHEGGKVEILLNKGSRKLQFDVKDSGPGLTEVQCERIFENFYRTDMGISTIAGTGLGLAIVKKNVEDLKGHVQVKSEIGHGSTFTVIF